MKKLSFLALLLVLCLPLASSAQEVAPKVEIFGGYSFLRSGSGDGPGGEDLGNVNAHGFNTSLAGNITKNIGIVGEFSRFTKSESADDILSDVFGVPIFSGIKVKASTSTFLFGPRFTLHRGKAEPFVHALFGAARDSFKVSAPALGIPGIPGISEEGSRYTFAYALGGGLDVKVHDNFAIRVAQLDFLQARNAGEGLNSFRYSVGIVIRLGNR